MMFLRPWRKHKLTWARGIGGVRMDVNGKYRVELTAIGWRLEGENRRMLWRKYRAEAMRTAELIEAGLYVPGRTQGDQS